MIFQNDNYETFSYGRQVCVATYGYTDRQTRLDLSIHVYSEYIAFEDDTWCRHFCHGSLLLVCHESDYRKYYESSKHAGTGINRAYNQGVSKKIRNWSSTLVVILGRLTYTRYS